MNNKTYQKQHHKIVHRPRPSTCPSTSYSSPNLVYNLNSNYNHQYNVNPGNNNTIVYKDFEEYNAKLSNYNRRKSNENIYFNAYKNNNNSVCYQTCCNCNNDVNNGLTRNYSMHNNKSYYDNSDNLIDYSYNQSDLRWKGLLPSDHYKRLVGPNPHVIYKKPTEKIQFNQRVDVKHYVPPSTPPPGLYF